MSKEAINRLILLHIPDTYALIIRATSHKLAIITNDKTPDPFLMTLEGAFIKSCTDFPKFNGHISTCGYKKIAIHNKINITDIMIMSMEGFTTDVVIV